MSFFAMFSPLACSLCRGEEQKAQKCKVCGGNIRSGGTESVDGICGDCGTCW